MTKAFNISPWIIAAGIIIIMLLIPVTRAILETIAKMLISFAAWIVGLIVIIIIIIWIIRKYNS